ncbi:hypothetical protein [Halomonas koreensis]|uniref:Uncharacterized protein n=1 Tax=Halomonas koreensis TaxID=245385 RepID=A0ABU1G5I7_9GAMM|nr:hypothetical protein [Halomonas koreensis]MDR5867961.1 hypothetical protein [Halomonas koreensis]
MEKHKPADKLPEPGRVVLICRNNGQMAIGSRNSQPLADSQDMSRQCHWNACYADRMAELECRTGIPFNVSFQDGTVEWWAEFTITA